MVITEFLLIMASRESKLLLASHLSSPPSPYALVILSRRGGHASRSPGQGFSCARYGAGPRRRSPKVPASAGPQTAGEAERRCLFWAAGHAPPALNPPHPTPSRLLKNPETSFYKLSWRLKGSNSNRCHFRLDSASPARCAGRRTRLLALGLGTPAVSARGCGRASSPAGEQPSPSGGQNEEGSPQPFQVLK